MGPTSQRQPAPAPLCVDYSFNELLVSLAALIEHHTRQLQQFNATKHRKDLDDRLRAAAAIKTCETLVHRLQATIRAAECAPHFDPAASFRF